VDISPEWMKVLAPVKNTTCRVEIFCHLQGVIERCVYVWSENGFSEKTASGSEGACGQVVTKI